MYAVEIFPVFRTILRYRTVCLQYFISDSLVKSELVKSEESGLFYIILDNFKFNEKNLLLLFLLDSGSEWVRVFKIPSL